MTDIDLQSPVPKYYQLQEIIRDMIDRGKWSEGQLIPSERELCERYEISRMTARQAVMELVNEGMLYRAQGRGTFVAGRKFQQQAARLTSFTQDMRERNMKTWSEVLELEVEGAGPVVSNLLQIRPGEKIIRLKRLRYADEKPISIETSHLRYNFAKGVLDMDPATSSLYDELRKLGVSIDHAEQSYEATLVNDSESEYLGVPQGSSALLIERVTYSNEKKPFEYVKSIYRGDRYRITTLLHS